MKRLLIAILVASLGWFGYWFIGSVGIQTGYEEWFEARRADGWQAEYKALHLRGFPNRFDTTFEDIALADPNTGFAWEAPFFQLFALSYRPNHIIAVWPEDHQLSTPQSKIAIRSGSMQASAVFEPNSKLTLKRGNLAIESAEISSDAGWTLSAESLLFALSQNEETDTLYQFAFQGQGVAPPQDLQNSVLPKTMSALNLDASVEFDRSWDILALEQQRPQPTQISIRTADAKWGDLELQVAGDLAVDNAGVPTGSVTIRVSKWREILEIARTTQQFPQISLDTVEQGLVLMSSLTGSGENIDVTLNFKRGMVFAGPLPLGPAPKLALR